MINRAKLHPKKIRDRNGKLTTVWVRVGEDPKTSHLTKKDFVEALEELAEYSPLDRGGMWQKPYMKWDVNKILGIEKKQYSYVRFDNPNEAANYIAKWNKHKLQENMQHIQSYIKELKEETAGVTHPIPYKRADIPEWMTQYKQKVDKIDFAKAGEDVLDGCLGYYDSENQRIRVLEGRPLFSERATVYHELFHAYHRNNGIITERKTSKDIIGLHTKFINEIKKSDLWDDLRTIKITQREESEEDVEGLYHEPIKGRIKKVMSRLESEMRELGVTDEAQIKTQVTDLMDLARSASPEHGGGHAIAYFYRVKKTKAKGLHFERKGKCYMEFFARVGTNYLLPNPLFEKYAPNTTKLINEYFDNQKKIKDDERAARSKR